MIRLLVGKTGTYGDALVDKEQEQVLSRQEPGAEHASLVTCDDRFCLVIL